MLFIQSPERVTRNYLVIIRDVTVFILSKCVCVCMRERERERERDREGGRK